MQVLKQIIKQLGELLYKYRSVRHSINGRDETNVVRYYKLKGLSINGVNINPNGTEKGNNRTPKGERFIEKFVGPIRPIYLGNTNGKQQTGGDAR